MNFDFGLINQITDLVGMDPRNWLGDKETALASVIVVDIWHWTPFCFLLLLAGLDRCRRTRTRQPGSTAHRGGRNCATSPCR